MDTPSPVGDLRQTPPEKMIAASGAAQANDTFEMLMGSAVPPRKRFIQTHAKDVVNLDI